MSKTERLSHIGVLIIAITAVVVSVWQGRISERQLDIAIEHNKLTVKPYLEFTKNINGSDQILEINLANQGYGPAIIQSFDLEYEGQNFDAWNPVLKASGLESSIRQLYNYDEGSVIAPGADRTILRLKTPNDQKGVSLNIVYKSIYDQMDTVRIDF